MKKLIHNHPRGLTAAIAVLVCCTGAARATVEQNKGTNAIAFSEERGDRSANLVLSTLDLAMMDPVERDNMLASLETQFGKPKVWASRAARSTSKSVFAFARDGEKEKYGVRLRARELPPVFNSEVSNTLPADNARVSEQIASASLLGVSRSEVLTWTVSQDNYLGNGIGKYDFVYHSNNKWWNTAFNISLPFGNGIYSPKWYGFSIKGKLKADIASRLEYNQWWYKAGKAGRDWGYTRDVTGRAALGVRLVVEAVLSWGYDWNFGPFGHWGLGAEVSTSIDNWFTGDVKMVSTNVKGEGDTFDFSAAPLAQLNVQGSVWIGNTENKDKDDDTRNPESHKVVNGVKGTITFEGNALVGVKYKCTEWDWYNDRWNNSMLNVGGFGNTRASGKFFARGEVKVGRYTYQHGYLLWTGSAQNDGYTYIGDTTNNSTMDWLL